MALLCSASESKRRILVDQARRKASLKRSNNSQHLDIEDLPITAPSGDKKITEINEAIDLYEQASPEKVTVVKLMNISERTVRRRWAIAKT